MIPVLAERNHLLEAGLSLQSSAKTQAPEESWKS